MSRKFIIFGLIVVLAGIVGFVYYKNLTIPDIVRLINNTNNEYDILKAKYGTHENFDQLVAEIKTAKERIAKNPNDEDAYITAANRYYNLGDYDDAWNYFVLANKIAPSDYVPVYWLARVKIQTGSYKEAEGFYLKAIDANPKAQLTYIDLARLYTFRLKEERDSGAIEKLLLRGLDNLPDNEDILRSLLSEYGRLNDKEKQIETIKKILAINPSDPQLKSALTELQSGK